MTANRHAGVQKTRLVRAGVIRRFVALAALCLLGPLVVPSPASAAAPTGDIVGWGDDSVGQIDIPVDLTGVTAISAGGFHNLALRSDGTVAAWGANGYGQSDVPADLDHVIAIAAGYVHSLALRNDGTVVAWGYGKNGQGNGQSDVPPGLSDVVGIAAGFYHNLAVKSDGTVVTWGNGYDGQWDIPAGLTDVVAVAAGGFHSLALQADGTVAAWGGRIGGGHGDFGQGRVPPGLRDIVAISAGYYHSMALRSDGTVAAWGWGYYGETTVPDGLTDVVAIAAGYEHSLALKADGSVVGWGWNGPVWNYYGQASPPASATDVFAISAGFQHSIALKTPPQAPQTISFGPPSAVAYGVGTVTMTATATSGLAVQFSVPPSAEGTCTSSGDHGEVITILAIGTCTVQADQSGGPAWLPAPQVTHSFGVTPASTSTQLTSSAPAVQLHQPITLHATVDAALTDGAHPTGTITFIADGTPLATTNLVSGEANYSTATLPVGTHLIEARYTPDSANFVSSDGTSTQQVSYQIKLDYDPTKPLQASSTLPIKLRLLDGYGADQSSPTLQIIAVGVDNDPALLKSSGNANPSNIFQLEAGSYQFNLRTTGLPRGTHRLDFVVSGDFTITYHAPFIIK